MELLTAGRYVISEIKNTIEGQGINTLPLKVYALKWLHFRFFQPLIFNFAYGLWAPKIFRVHSYGYSIIEAIIKHSKFTPKLLKND